MKIKLKCKECNFEKTHHSVWDFHLKYCEECNSDNLEVYLDANLILDKSSPICEICDEIYLPSNWLSQKRQSFCRDCYEKPAPQANDSINRNKEIARIPEKWRKCYRGHATHIQVNSKNGQEFIACTMFPNCKWTRSLPKEI